MAENMNKHQRMARTGKFEGISGSKEIEDHHPSVGKHHGSIHNVTSETGESTSSWDTESIGTDGGKKHESGGGTGSTRNPI